MRFIETGPWSQKVVFVAQLAVLYIALRMTKFSKFARRARFLFLRPNKQQPSKIGNCNRQPFVVSHMVSYVKSQKCSVIIHCVTDRLHADIITIHSFGETLCVPESCATSLIRSIPRLIYMDKTSMTHGGRLKERDSKAISVVKLFHV